MKTLKTSESNIAFHFYMEANNEQLLQYLGKYAELNRYQLELLGKTGLSRLLDSLKEEGADEAIEIVMCIINSVTSIIMAVQDVTDRSEPSNDRALNDGLMGEIVCIAERYGNKDLSLASACEGIANSGSDDDSVESDALKHLIDLYIDLAETLEDIRSASAIVAEYDIIDEGGENDEA